MKFMQVNMLILCAHQTVNTMGRRARERTCLMMDIHIRYYYHLSGCDLQNDRVSTQVKELSPSSKEMCSTYLV